MTIKVAANATKTKVFNSVMKGRPKIWLSESLSEFLSTLVLPAQSFAYSPVAIRNLEEEGERRSTRDMENFSGGSDHVLRRWRGLARYQQGSVLQLESGWRSYMGNDRNEPRWDNSRWHRGCA